jgi:ATP-dependent DNA helicase DinG
MLTPVDFGLPSKFTRWRPDQLSAINYIIDSPSRFIAICAPTGFGKSLVYEAAAKLSGLRTIILTSTKGLQDQLTTDFGEINRDIRGKTNYKCPAAAALGLPPYTVVADSPCQGGYNCPLRGNGQCEYYEKYRIAQRADIVTTNYACWFYDSVRKDKLDEVRPCDMLVLDEAHDAPEQLAGYLSTEIERKDCHGLGVEWPDPSKMVFDDWKSWARKWGQVASEQTKSTTDHKRGIVWRKIGMKLARVATMNREEDWIIDTKFGVRDKIYPLSVHFDPLWVQPYAESALFRGVRKVVLVSATLRPKTLALLGVSESDATFVEFPSSFPVARRPVIHVPTVQMNFRTENDDYKLGMWLNKIDMILDQRQDRRGIIHAVSYKRARLIYDNSRHSSRMLIHGSENAREVIQKFKSTSAPLVLISPSVSTGYDFPYKECEFQIIGKIPFPSTVDLINRARSKQDKDYLNYIAMQVLIQSVGRGMRAVDDQCETLVIDDNMLWFIRQNGLRFAPKWFRDAITYSNNVPEPLPKL